MTFLLGIHEPAWLARLIIPMFISRKRLARRKRLPVAMGAWALDSGGFSELTQEGGWSITASQYVREVRRYNEAIGQMLWAPVMDWMCEPQVLQRTGLSVAEHQARTVESYQELRGLAPDLPWVPVLQGWEPDDYRCHWDAYETAGISLAQLPLVGVGSVCRRQNTEEAARIVRQLSPLKLHAFGFKMTGLTAAASSLVSADSMAWSLHARYRPAFFPECRHRNCSECERWALHWRDKVLSCIRKN